MRLTRSLLGYFKRYVDHEIATTKGKTVYKNVYGWKRVQFDYKPWVYGEDRPWTDAAKHMNLTKNAKATKLRSTLVEPIKDWLIFRGDRNFSTKMADTVSEGILLGLGNPLLDITVVCPDNALLDKYGLLANNAIIAAEVHHPLYEEMVKNYKPEYLPGGATLNSVRVAQWLLQKPNATTFFGGVGQDKYAEILKKKSIDVGVNVRYQVHSDVQTGVCGAIITGEDRSLVTELGAAQHFCVDFLKKPENWKLVEAAQCYYAGGFILPVSKESVLALAHHSTENKKTMVINLHATFLCGMFADPKINILPYIDILFGNSDEAAEFCSIMGFPNKDLKQMALQVAALPKVNSERERIVVFTQGRDPTIVAQGGKVSEYPVETVDHDLIKDTNGCGDSFVGGFLSQWVLGRSVQDCVRCGFYAAKVVIQHYGCQYPAKPNFV
ncbi:adenosine kinase isoform X2 [Octopus sinensis]|uniref:Adenosine kinase n=1 Tax=Octopus sinensis TaxID=2607531 RepID=A0A7E6FDN6_9MOLL|nr:adenosine kinase isoform X2 [Octopus sinensis]